MYSQSCPIKRATHQWLINKIGLDTLVYVDESGIDHNICKAHSWSPVGQPTLAKRSGKRSPRTNIIGGLLRSKPIALMSFEGSCNTEIFNSWLTNFLLPELWPGMTVVMDNASFHHSPQTRKLIENAGCKLLYLPPYSPDLNPIEQFWAQMKLWLRNARSKFKNFTEALREFFVKHST